MNRLRFSSLALAIFLLGLGAGWLLSHTPPAPVEAQEPPAAARKEAPAPPPDDGKLRIICFGAHPDDCELKAGGTALLWSQAGHHVKFVSVTNGDIGHWRDAGGPLARRRADEVRRADRLLGVTPEVLDLHDGELMPTLENRRTITELIRGWKADVLISHRPNDYHPDHRYTGVLVQDSAYMVTVPFFCPYVPILQKNPVFLYYSDRFQKPNPFDPDIVVSIDPVIEKKAQALAIMESQFYEGGANGSADLIPKDPEAQERRKREVAQRLVARNENEARQYREQLVEWYGKGKGEKVRYAEAFEVCEYGAQPRRAELAKLFPFVGEGGEGR